MELTATTVMVYVTVRARDPDGILVVEGPGGRSLPHRVFDGSGSLDSAAAGILMDLGAAVRPALAFVQCVTVGRPSMVAFLFVSYREARPIFEDEGCAWIDPGGPSGPMDGLSAHFAVRTVRPFGDPYVDLGLNVPGVFLADAG